MYELVSLLSNGLIVGFITFQIGINTAIIFTKLDTENASVLLRAIFPKFFLTIFVFSSISFISLYLSGNEVLVLNLSAITIILAGVCFFIIPATNDARDKGNDRLFSIYHSISVFSTLIILVINIISFFSYRVVSI